MRALSAEEAALWEKVTREVRAFRARPQPAAPAPEQATPNAAQAPKPLPRPAAPRSPPQRPRPGTTLDASWDRKLARGDAVPDMVIDLHGHDLAGAYDAIDSGLARALARGARIVLLITGHPPTGAEPPIRRGVIRAAVGDWLDASPHARHIAAVRNASRRHGGGGALYIVLRRAS